METAEISTLQILSAKTRNYKGKGRVLDVEYNEIIERDGKIISTRNIVNKDQKGELVHDSLINSLKAFLPHFLLATESANINEFPEDYFKKKEYNKKEYNYRIAGISIKEVNGHNSVLIKGQKVLKNDRVIPMNTELIQYQYDEENESQDKYPLYKHLAEAVDGYITEVEKYLNGHHAASPQTELEFDGDVSDDEEKETKTRKKK